MLYLEKKRAAALVLISFAFVGIIVFLGVTSGTREFPDTEHYFNVARAVTDLKSLFFALRPALITLFFKLFMHNDPVIVAVQTVIYVFAWLFLAFTLLATVRPFAAACGLAVLAAYFGLYPEFTLWNKTVLSDSLSISFTVLAFTFLLRWIVTRRDFDLAVWFACLIVNTYLRDFNAYYALVLVALVPVLYALKLLTFRRFAVVSAVLVANFLIAAYAADHAGQKETDARWYFAMLNNIGRRVLPNPEILQFFADRGMPVSPTLMKMTSKYAHEENWTFYEAAELKDFRTWVRRHGVSTYGSYLAHNPVYAVSSMVPRRDDLFQHNFFSVGYYIADGYKAGLVPRIDHKYIYGLNALLIAVMFAAALWRRSLELTGYAILALLFFASVIPFPFIAFHAGSDMEVARHSLSVPLQNVLALIFSAYLLFTKAVGPRRPESLSSVTPAVPAPG